MSAGGSNKAVVAALGSNLGIALIKFVAFAITGSASMLAEGVHSVVDSGNQVLLLVGGRRSQREADREHPFGYGRDRYVYGFLVALMLFSAGGLFALYEGVQKVRHPHHLDDALIAVIVLAVAICLESFSLHTAIGESRHLKGGDTWVGFIRHSKVPELPVVLLEDVAALDRTRLGLRRRRLVGAHRRRRVGRHRHLRDRCVADQRRHHFGDRDEEPAARRVGGAGRGRRNSCGAARPWRGTSDPPANDAPRPR